MPATPRALRLLHVALAAVCLTCAALALWWGRRWPLVGDASLLHYLCFLVDRGMAPYRDLPDMNMPGAYLVEWTAMHTLGPGPLAWRAFDLLLLLAGAAAMLLITLPSDAFAGILAGALVAVIHLLDGLEQAGQRDLTMAVLLLLAAAAAVRALRRTGPAPAWSALAGVSLGLAATIKPTALLFAVMLLGIALVERRSGRHRIFRRSAAAALLGTLVAPALSLLLLARFHAVPAFLRMLREILPFYASLGHRSFGFLLAHCLSPVVPLAVVWVLVLLLRGRRPGRSTQALERTILLAGTVFGVVSYFAQARGFPYHRYPLLIFFLPLAVLDLDHTLRDWRPRRWRPRAAQALALLGLAGTALIIAPVSTRLIHPYQWRETPVEDALARELTELGGPQLSGSVQCIDWVSGCSTTLLRLQLRPATGVLTDFLLFGPDRLPAVRSARARLEHRLATDPPRVIVVSSFLHLVGLTDYTKLTLWPEFAAELARDYDLRTEWTPARPVLWVGSRPVWPRGFRIYVRRRVPAA